MWGKNNSTCFCMRFKVSQMLSSRYPLALTTAPRYSQDKELLPIWWMRKTEAQRGQGTCSRKLNELVAQPGLEPQASFTLRCGLGGLSIGHACAHMHTHISLHTCMHTGACMHTHTRSTCAGCHGLQPDHGLLCHLGGGEALYGERNARVPGT